MSTDLNLVLVMLAIQAADVNLVALPDSVSFVTAACLGCRFATAFRALTVHGRLGAALPGSCPKKPSLASGETARRLNRTPRSLAERDLDE